MRRAQQGHQRYERNAREAFAFDGSKEKFYERSSGGTSKTDIPRNQRLGKKIFGEELELLETKVILEEWLKEGRDAKAEEGRAKVTAGGRATRQAVAGSRSSEAEVELRLADVNGRRGTEDTVVAWSGFTRAVSQKRRNRRLVPSIEERVIVGKVKEQMKQLPLEVVRAPKWRVIFASQSAAAEGESSNTRGVGGDARLCLRTEMDYVGK